MSTTQLCDANGETAPERFCVARDEYHARYVGRTADGRQFFVTTPFVATSSPDNGATCAARYWNVTIEPGDYMAFRSPWDNGEYDT